MHKMRTIGENISSPIQLQIVSQFPQKIFLHLLVLHFTEEMVAMKAVPKKRKENPIRFLFTNNTRGK